MQYLLIFFFISNRKEKNILECDKCLRSVGLWLYKQYQTNADDVESNDTLKNSNSHEGEESMLFSSTDPYSDDFTIKNLLNKRVNSIEIEHESSLKNLNGKDKRPTSVPLESKKRKQTCSTNDDDARYSSAIGDHKKKLLDPVREHFSWCPWLKEISSAELNKYKLKDSMHAKENIEQSNKSVCQINFEIINRKLTDIKNPRKTNNCEENLAKKLCSQNSVTILEQVRSAQSILMNFTSQFSLK